MHEARLPPCPVTCAQPTNATVTRSRPGLTRPSADVSRYRLTKRRSSTSADYGFWRAAGSHPNGAVRLVPSLVITVGGRRLARILRAKIRNAWSATRPSSLE